VKPKPERDREAGNRSGLSGHATVTALLLGIGVTTALFGAHASTGGSPPTDLARSGDAYAPLGRSALRAEAATPDRDPDDVREVLQGYCFRCHNDIRRTADIDLESLDIETPFPDASTWETVIRKLRTGTMPPGNEPRPEQAEYDLVADYLESEIDRVAANVTADPGTTNPVHRLNRLEYNHAINDLLGIDVDVRNLLPGDETADGSFDNFADQLSITTTHMERYMSVARQVTRLAVGLPPTAPGVETYEVPLHVIQDQRQSEDLPFGSRGGISVRHDFLVDGEYLIRIRLRRQYQDYLMGMGWPQQVDLRVDGELVQRFDIGGGALQYRPAAASYAGSGEPGSFGDPEWEEYMQVGGDAHLEVRIPIKAGPRVLGVSFVREQFEPEGLPQPVQRGRVLTNDQIYMDIASVHSLQIGGPYEITGTGGDTPSRREIFVCRPRTGETEEVCATTILSRLARRAYRRPVTDADVEMLLEFFEEGREEGGSFDAGIQLALERLVVDPEFLLRVYRTPDGVGPGEP